MSKHLCVVYAEPARQRLWPVELPQQATVREALEAARSLARLAGEEAGVPWGSASVGIFGEPCGPGDIPREGDRIEIYRPLASDPRERRRQQTRRR